MVFFAAVGVVVFLVAVGAVVFVAVEPGLVVFTGVGPACAVGAASEGDGSVEGSEAGLSTIDDPGHPAELVGWLSPADSTTAGDPEGSPTPADASTPPPQQQRTMISPTIPRPATVIRVARSKPRNQLRRLSMNAYTA